MVWVAAWRRRAVLGPSAGTLRSMAFCSSVAAMETAARTLRLVVWAARGILGFQSVQSVVTAVSKPLLAVLAKTVCILRAAMVT